MSVDGTDSSIIELTLFDCKWYSHKFKGSELRNDVCISINRRKIV